MKVFFYYKMWEFGKFEDPTEIIPYCDNEYKGNYLFEYMKLTDINISAPLFSFMLLALLSSFDLCGRCKRPDFVVALTGGNRNSRRKAALFFTNLYKRNYIIESDYDEFYHVTEKDTAAEMHFKSQYAKDSVLIVFEHNKRRITTLFDKKMYGSGQIDEERPIRSLCLITCKDCECFKNKGNMLEVNTDIFNWNNIEEFYMYDKGYNYEKLACDCGDDYLSDNVYYFIECLIKKLYFSKQIKKTLAELNYIHTYTKKDGLVEYSVHLQKPLYGNTKSNHRYIKFDRMECANKGIFKKIELRIVLIELKADMDKKRADKHQENL